MAHVFRFIARFTGDGWVITDDELVHLSKVLKLGAGEVVEVMDGKGRWAHGIITEVRHREAIVSADSLFEEPPKAPRVEVAVGALRHGSLDDLLSSLTELGVAAIHSFHQADTDKKRINDRAKARWQRILLAACKQCKRAWLPEINTHSSLLELIDQWANVAAHRVVLDPQASPALVDLVPDKPVLIVLGGEKGLGEHELKQLTDAGFEGYRLGPHVLRASTAMLASASVIAGRLESSGQ